MTMQNNTEPEKLLSVGEPGIEVSALPITRTPAEPIEPVVALPGVPSQKQQQWGVVISIIVIVGMIVIGAFYSWGKRIAEQNPSAAASIAQ